MTLLEYIEKHGLTYHKMGHRLGCTRQMAWRIANGKTKKISLNMAFRIEDKTNGEVTARSFDK